MLKLATAVTAALALAVPSSAAGAGFEEPVKVLWQHTGADGYYFGWAVSPLEDVNRDGVTDAIIAEPGNNAPSGDFGTTWISSGRTGAPLVRFDGKPGDQSAFSVADVGDLNRPLDAAGAADRHEHAQRLTELCQAVGSTGLVLPNGAQQPDPIVTLDDDVALVAEQHSARLRRSWAGTVGRGPTLLPTLLQPRADTCSRE